MRKDLLSVPQAAKYCSLSRGTVWSYVKKGELKASQTPGGQFRIHKKDLENFMRKKGMYPVANYQPPNSKILIVDDDPKILKMLTKALSRKKYGTEVASDGFEAGTKIMKFQPGLVVLDLIMPGMSGFEVCKKIKEDSDTSHIKVLAITGYDNEENKKRIMEAGADGYMPKPLEMKELIINIEDLLKDNEKSPLR